MATLTWLNGYIVWVMENAVSAPEIYPVPTTYLLFCIARLPHTIHWPCEREQNPLKYYCAIRNKQRFLTSIQFNSANANIHAHTHMYTQITEPIYYIWRSIEQQHQHQKQLQHQYSDCPPSIGRLFFENSRANSPLPALAICNLLVSCVCVCVCVFSAILMTWGGL